MPMKSQAQRAWMHTHHPKMADRWEEHTPKGAKLPKRVGEDDQSLAQKSHSEEEKAITDYGEREKRAQSPSLKRVFKHARSEEQEHAADFERQMESTTPRMSSVFHISEAPIQNRPPPGSQPEKPSDWNSLGRIGQSLKKGLEGMKMAGQEMRPYKTPGGDTLAFPVDAAPGRGPMKADTTKGIWTQQTGSAAGTPTPALSPTTTMK